MRSRVLVLLIAAFLSGVAAAGASFAGDGRSETVESPPFGGEPPTAAEGPAHAGYPFVENVGQLSRSPVRYLATAGSIQVGFAEGSVLMNLLEPAPTPAADRGDVVRGPTETPRRGVNVRITFEGASAVVPMGRGVAPYATNYILGRDPAGWRAGARSYQEVVYPDLYPGIDLVWGTLEGALKYELVLRAGADPDAVRFAYEGVEALDFDGTDVVVHTGVADLRDSMSLVYQASGAPVACRPVPRGPTSVGYSCDGWDRRGALVIDPLLFGTYLGGGDWEYGLGIAADPEGNAYAVGSTRSTDFPATPGAFDTTSTGTLDVFVAKFNATGALVYATYLGGDSFDWAYTVSVDAAGLATVSGTTESPDFPTTPGAFDTAIGGSEDGFVVRLNESGSALVFGTYFGGSSSDGLAEHAVGPSGDLYLTGFTWSNESSFPVTPGAYDTTFNSVLGPDAYIARLDASGSTLEFATYLGGSSSEYPTAIAVDAGGNAYVTGQVLSNETTFPVTPGAFDTTYNGNWDVFVAKLNATDLVYATYIGGDSRWGDDTGTAITVDATGRAFVAGRTGSNETTFPVTPGAFDTTHDNRWRDAFVASLSPDGSALEYCTYLGGLLPDEAEDLAMNPLGGVFVVGTTGSLDFPVTAGAFDATSESSEAFLTGLSDDGSALTYSTYIGGGGGEEGEGLAVDPSGNLYVTGRTASTDFPTTPGAFDRTSDGVWDAFAVKFGAIVSVPPQLDVAPARLDFGTVRPEYTGNLTFQVRNAGGGSLRYQINASAPWLSIAPAGGTSLWEWDVVTVSVDASAATHGPNSAVIGVDSDGGTQGVVVDVVVDSPPDARATSQPDRGNLSTSFVFDGSASTDPDGDALNFSWDLGDGAVAYGPVVAHAYATRDGYSAALRVTDAFGLSDEVLVSVSVENRPPAADAGRDDVVVRDAVVVLDGTASSDPDGDPISYAWTQLSGPPVSLRNPGGSMTTFVPAELGSYVFRLTVGDALATAAASVTVEVVNRVPAVFAGPDMTAIPPGREVRLAASGWDPDGDPLAYAWIQEGGPPVPLSGEGTASPTFTPRVVGEYSFRVTVTDGNGGSAVDFVNVTVEQAAAAPGVPVLEWSLLAAVVVAVVAAAFVLGRRRRPGSDEGQDPAAAQEAPPGDPASKRK